MRGDKFLAHTCGGTVGYTHVGYSGYSECLAKLTKNNWRSPTQVGFRVSRTFRRGGGSLSKVMDSLAIYQV